VYVDDYYACDIQGSTNNDFLGDVRVQAVFPNGNGNYSQLTNDLGNMTNNYTHVDEADPNDDTDYVESSNAGDKDTYTYQDLPTTTGTVYGVQVMTYAKKTDSGSRTIRNLARLSGTDADNGSDIALPSGYTYLPSIFETKPGGGAWTITDVNNAEFGVKVTA
jgi:hypothetical protein